MIKLTDALLSTKLENIPEEKYKEAFSLAIQVKTWITNRKAYAIAANQLGLPFRFFVVDNYKRYGFPTDVFFNPTFEAENPDEIFMSQESCLSYPGKSFVVHRHPKIHMKYYDPREKKQCECFLTKIGAIVAQHEISHLDGITDEMLMEQLYNKIEEAKAKQNDDPKINQES